MSLNYDEYLNEHIANVTKALNWMEENCRMTVDSRLIRYALEEAAHHDDSKLTLDEYGAYDTYFCGGNRTHEVRENFDYAWLHHQNTNKHHWQYWVLINDDPKAEAPAAGLRPLRMPMIYIYEMIADWWAFSWKNNNLFEIFSWYNQHHQYQIMHPETRAVVNDILQEIWTVLIAKELAANHDVSEIEKQYEPYWLKKQDPELKHEDSDPDPKDIHKYGVPELKKFPMPDAKHVRSAIRFFNYIDLGHEKELALAILKRMDEYGMSFDDFEVGDENRFKNYIPEKYQHLEHHGRLGQKWGEQHGPPYPLDQDTVKSSYGGDAKIYKSQKETGETEKSESHRHTVFVSGSSKTQSEDSEYYRKELPKSIRNELDAHMKKGNKIIVGDAPGVDRQVQDYLNKAGYEHVEIYGPGKKVRYSANDKWKTNPIDDPDHEEGSKEWLAKKDKAMSDAADEGLAVILDEGARATRENVSRLLDDNKDVKVLELNKDGSEHDEFVDAKNVSAKAKLNKVNDLNDEMNSKWDYGVLYQGTHVTDLDDFDWGNNYRTTPIEILEKEKIGTCWDFVNYQHSKLKSMKIKDDSYLIAIQKSDNPDDIVTHTFTILNLNGKKYWLESAAWPKRGLHEINDIKDVAKDLNDMYHNPGRGYSIFKYNPEGMDKHLTDKEFFEKATENLILDSKPKNKE